MNIFDEELQNGMNAPEESGEEFPAIAGPIANENELPETVLDAEETEIEEDTYTDCEDEEYEYEYEPPEEGEYDEE